MILASPCGQCKISPTFGQMSLVNPLFLGWLKYPSLLDESRHPKMSSTLWFWSSVFETYSSYPFLDGENCESDFPPHANQTHYCSSQIFHKINVKKEDVPSWQPQDMWWWSCSLQEHHLFSGQVPCQELQPLDYMCRWPNSEALWRGQSLMAKTTPKGCEVSWNSRQHMVIVRQVLSNWPIQNTIAYIMTCILQSDWTILRVIPTPYHKKIAQSVTAKQVIPYNYINSEWYIQSRKVYHQ